MAESARPRRPSFSACPSALFPSLQPAYDAWHSELNTAPLARLVKQGEAQWLEAARQLTAIYHHDLAQGDAQLDALATSDLASLRL